MTSKVADVASRVQSARGAITRLRVLYQHAHKVSDVINIESELNSRESDLESLQAQARALAAETSTAAITLSLSSPPPAKPKPVPPKHTSRSGFLGGLSNGWHAFTKGISVLATVVGAVLPFAVLVVVLLLAGRLVWGRFRPTRPTPDAPGPAGT